MDIKIVILKQNKHRVGFEVFTAVVLKSMRHIPEEDTLQKQAPVNKIIKTNFLCYAPHIRELYKKNYS
jgi:hypothetical protein